MQEPIEKVWIFAPTSLLWSGIEALLRAERFRARLTDGDFQTVDWNDPRFDDAIIIFGADRPDQQIAEHIQMISDARGPTPIVLVLSQDDHRAALSAIAAGASGIIHEDDDAHSMVTCVREIARGREWVSQSVISAALNRGLDQHQSLYAPLTARERQVADLIAAGRSTDTVASELEMAAGTVKVHLHNIYKKLAIPDRGQLIRLILEERTRN
ncbi:response regulator transcription factor [Parasphingopyxis sp. CP4]|uniref:helix-turn-helix transcriptional regulator n=1 Tax=Parasphingopyxis sp. CP4 TaxID=2724527 RepID=UPI0015A1553D|nr:LuxR C-terminal-related transcriptional regulator [Parasphingopyxis sp. CP4]QLC22425.1 response regulator transcription factor [Parasphingopyxis sp. CP4]